MYPADFMQALEMTLAEEGGFSDVAGDTGGKTMAGVTQRTYDEYRDELNLLHRSVKFSTAEERVDLYHLLYWTRGRCDMLGKPASLMHFDSCVNHGCGNAAMILQAIVGARPIDGGFGPITLKAVLKFEPKDLARKIVTTRRGFYVGLLVEDTKDADVKFINGWLNRMDHIERVL
jgi:lysozyme family protein